MSRWWGFGRLKEEIKDVVQDYVIKHKPAQIYNLDENGFCTYPFKTEVVMEKWKSAHHTIEGSGRENTTVLTCGNAAGKTLPP